MKEYTINEKEAGQRFDKYLSKRLALAPKSFLYKMLRKKNITLNGKKAEGKEILAPGDLVRMFLSDETVEHFTEKQKHRKSGSGLSVLYEDEDILLVDKPAGILAQPDRSGENSMVDEVTAYLLESGSISEEELVSFHPAVCNRLDRNTSGILCAGKTVAGLQFLSGLFHDRTIHKEYLCICEGIIKKEKKCKGYLHKDRKCNKVVVHFSAEKEDLPVELICRPVCASGDYTLASVTLITGRPHQIRAQMAAEGHTLLGDPKYARTASAVPARKRPRVRRQMLHAYLLRFPVLDGRFGYLSEKTITAPLPDDFRSSMKALSLSLDF